MTAPVEIVELTQRFDEHAEAYKQGHYNETQIRREFIDPFFRALGWDIDNTAGYAEAYKDVIHEDAIKVSGRTKAPDYCFRIGGSRKFFAEAKKPSVNIKMDIGPAYQLRRYAWSAKLPLSILTDFEELAVYDCRVKPDKSDKASVARTLYVEYREYPERWEEIAAIFSREAVLKGSFDKYAQSAKKKRGTAEVDDAFLAEIEEWRDTLARNIALRNPDLSQRDLNYAVQVTIDRLIFLRICEDRGIEDYGTLQGLRNGDRVYERLFERFRRADERYNSGLFHFSVEKGRSEHPDDLTPNLSIDDKTLKGILSRLYYPESPYEFAVLPADILGQVYEQFLGKVIRLTKGHRAVVEEKPEVRKAGGVYYTPTYIVDYIVKNTVGKLVEGKTPQEVGGLTKQHKPSKRGRPITVLDPACGSGSFLLGAYQFLLDWCRDQYIEEGVARHTTGKQPRMYQHPSGEWRLTTTERKRILLSHIYGVDIDAQAVETTKLSLLLKVLEGENAETLGTTLRLFHERALPDLAGNIKCGNSLIGPDFYDSRQLGMFDDEERYRINAFDWQAEFGRIMRAGGFDAVIGNPPYDVLEKERGAASWPHAALLSYVEDRATYSGAMGGKRNLFRFFLIQSLNLTRGGGTFGMIVPLALLADISCRNTREHVIRGTQELRADCFPQKDIARRRVFLNAKLSTVVLTARRRSARGDNSDASVHVVKYPWNSFADEAAECTVRLEQASLMDPENAPIPLLDDQSLRLCVRLYSSERIVHLGRVAEIHVTRGEINQTVYREYISPNDRLKRLVKGVEIGQWHVRERLSQGRREWFDEERFLNEHTPRPEVLLHRIATQRITGVDERLRIVATLIEPPAYFADSTNSVLLDQGSEYDLRYILALLNSRLYQWRFKLTSTNNNVGTNELAAMPFRTIDVSDDRERAAHERLVSLAQAMLDLHLRLGSAKAGHGRTVLEREIDATTGQIDKLVYELYDLTDEEIAIVEEATR